MAARGGKPMSRAEVLDLVVHQAGGVQTDPLATMRALDEPGTIYYLLQLASGDAIALQDAATHRPGGVDGIGAAAVGFIERHCLGQDQDPWTTLGLAHGSSAAEVTRQYRQMIRVFHPDRGNVPADAAQSYSARINTAYAALTEVPEPRPEQAGAVTRPDYRRQSARGDLPVVRPRTLVAAGLGLLLVLSLGFLVEINLDRSPELVAAEDAAGLERDLQSAGQDVARREQLTRQAQARQDKLARQEQDRRDQLARHEQAKQEKLARQEQDRRDQLARLEQAKQEKLTRLEQAKQEKLARLEQAKQEKLARLEQAKQEKLARQEQAKQEKLARQEQVKQEKLARQDVLRRRDPPTAPAQASQAPEPVRAQVPTPAARTPDPVPQVAAAPAQPSPPAPAPNASAHLAEVKTQPAPPAALTQAQLRGVVMQFLDSYNQGSLERLMALVGDDLRTTDSGTRDDLRATYGMLFAQTDRREMVLKDLRWDIIGAKATGSMVYSARVVNHGSQTPTNLDGSLRLEVVLVNQRPQIVGLFAKGGHE